MAGWAQAAVLRTWTGCRGAWCSQTCDGVEEGGSPGACFGRDTGDARCGAEEACIGCEAQVAGHRQHSRACGLWWLQSTS
jgi:hypothetical protein